MSESTIIFEKIEEYKSEFSSLLLLAMKEGIREVSNVVQNKKYIGTYHDWPTMSYFKNGLPNLSSSPFQGAIEYRRCFGSSKVRFSNN